MENTTHHDTLPKLLFHHASTRANATAIRVKYRGIWRVSTWRELSEEVRDLAYALSSLGLRRGDHIAMVGDLDGRLFNLIAAAQCLGAIPVNIAADAGRAELLDSLSRFDTHFAVVENVELLDRLISVQSHNSSLETFVLLDSRGMELYDQVSVFAYDNLRRLGTQLHAETPEMITRELSKGVASDTAAVLYESSSSGESTAIPLTHASWISAARNTAQQLNFTEREELMCLLSPAYAWSFLFYYATFLVVGYRVNFPEAHDTVLTNMREIGPTFWFASPNAYKQVASLANIKMQDCGWIKRALFNSVMNQSSAADSTQPNGRGGSSFGRLLRPLAQTMIFRPMKEVLGLSRVRTVVTVSDAVGAEERAFYNALHIGMKKFYGPTAACGMLTIRDDSGDNLSDVGRPVGDMELRIGKSKEIEFKGSHSGSASPDQGDGWCKTGDVGVLDGNGRLSLLGSVNELGTLADGTEFIPSAVEQSLRSSPYIKHAVAFGDQKPFVTALIVLDAESVSVWADRNGISISSSSACADNDEIYGLVNMQVSQVNRQLAASGRGKLQVKRFAILRDDLDPDAGELTYKKQPCRSVIEANNADLVAALFGDGAEYVADTSGSDAKAGTNSAAPVRISSLTPTAEVIHARRSPTGGSSWQAARSGT